MSYKTYSQVYKTPDLPQQDLNSHSKDPNEWGPHLWKYLHTAAANYPDNPNQDDINNMTVWLKTLFVTIPCTHCREHYKMYIENNDQNLYAICSNRTNLFQFVVNLHNWVNKKTGKKEWSFEDARSMYF